MNDLQRKRISRTALRRHCTKFENDISQLLDNNTDDTHLDLQALKLNYESQIKRIGVVDEEILNLVTTDEEVEKEISDSLKANDTFYRTLSQIDHALKEEKGEVKPLVSASLRMERSPGEQKVKLPKIRASEYVRQYLISSQSS